MYIYIYIYIYREREVFLLCVFLLSIRSVQQRKAKAMPPAGPPQSGFNLHSAQGGAVETGCSGLHKNYRLFCCIILPQSTAPPCNEYPFESPAL